MNHRPNSSVLHCVIQYLCHLAGISESIRVNSIQTARREELLVDSVNLAEGAGIAVTARASERITPPNRSVSAK